MGVAMSVSNTVPSARRKFSRHESLLQDFSICRARISAIKLMVAPDSPFAIHPGGIFRLVAELHAGSHHNLPKYQGCWKNFKKSSLKSCRPKPAGYYGTTSEFGP